MNALLDVRNVVKRFPLKSGRAWWRRTRMRPQVFAVDDVSFTIGKGESIGLVGESGCGKSTLVRLVARLLDQTAGTIAFDGTDIGAIPALRFGRVLQRADIQMVFQDPTDSLNPRLTAFDAIADPVRRLKSFTRREVTSRVEEVARLCGLSVELLGRFPHQLSGGQKARVGIARALAVEARLLILDEPTSALDASVQVVILHLLQDLKKRLGLSYLFVSHDLNVVRLLCTRVLVMYSGRIVESGPATEIFTAPRHPYTAALLSAIPSGQPGSHTRIMLPGEPVSPVDPDPKACRFYGRCPKGVDRCAQTMPALAPVSPLHDVACHFPEPVGSPDARPLAGTSATQV